MDENPDRLSLRLSMRTPQVPFGMRCWLPTRPSPAPNLLFWTERGNIGQHMSPSVNEHFQHVENNNLARRAPPSGCDEPVHLSQPPALFLAAAETVSTRQLFKEPHIKGGKVERLAS